MLRSQWYSANVDFLNTGVLNFNVNGLNVDYRKVYSKRISLQKSLPKNREYLHSTHFIMHKRLPLLKENLYLQEV